MVKFLPPDISLLESKTIALLAAAVPAVIPSSCSKSASDITALPIVKLVAQVIVLLKVAAPAALPSKVKNVVSAPPSVPLKMISVSFPCASKVILPALVARVTAPSPVPISSATTLALTAPVPKPAMCNI